MTNFETRAIHDGQEHDRHTGAVIPPIHLSTTFAQDGVGGLRGGYEYGRSGNPTRSALQQSLASLESGTHAFAFSSGLAAEDTLLRALVAPGDRILIGNDAYGGTYRLISKVFGPWGVDNSAVDLTDTVAATAAISTLRPRVVWVETPSNPVLGIVDIAAIADATHKVGATLVVDNTFATPALQQPLTLGADVIVHSTTKYIGGHSDVVGGALVVNDGALAEQIAFLHNAVGAIAAPFDSYLTHRGIKTLAVRMERHSANALEIATRLVDHPAIEQVIYPGLSSHPGHEVAARQMSQFGGMVSVILAGGEEAARHFVSRTTLFTLAESLGGVESLIELPSAMTHASVSGTALEVPGSLVRLSVGIEHVEDLYADLLGALSD